jgi:hypothetical protein
LEVDRWLDDDEPHKIKIPSQDEDHEKESKKVCVCCATHAPGEMDEHQFDPLWGVNLDNVDEDSVLFGPSEIPANSGTKTWHPPARGRAKDYRYSISNGCFFWKGANGEQSNADHYEVNDTEPKHYSYLMTTDKKIYAFLEKPFSDKISHGQLAHLLVNDGIVSRPIFISAGEIHLNPQFPYEIQLISNESGHFLPPPVSCMFLLNELKNTWKGGEELLVINPNEKDGKGHDVMKEVDLLPYTIGMNIFRPDGMKMFRFEFGAAQHSYELIVPKKAASKAEDKKKKAALAPGGAHSTGDHQGWTEKVSRSTGKTYYLNNATGETQWDPPIAAAGCKVQGCTEDHSKHYCKWCKDGDSDHLSSNCQKKPE